MTRLAPDYQTPERMAAKRAAIRLPELRGRRVLDVGTDHGYWAFLAAEAGAAQVLGIDRNRAMRGMGMVDLVAMNRLRSAAEGLDHVRFEHINLGRQWREFGTFDVLLVMSVYHHCFEQCGDHLPIWFWLRRHCADDAVVVWEGPIDDSDPVVRANVSEEHRAAYTLEAILAAASVYFNAERVGPALHEPTREVWHFRPKVGRYHIIDALMLTGAGGAAPAFNHAGGRRIGEIEAALGFRPVAGSLNLTCGAAMEWDRDYYRAQILDVVARGKGLDVEWAPRWARFKPVEINGVPAFAFRFEGERYGGAFVEVLADRRLRDVVCDPVMLRC